jgi:hypothetical protein
MKSPVTGYALIGWLFAMLLVTIGILNLIYIHPVPGGIYLFLSLLYMPPLNELLRQKTGRVMPMAVKIVLGVVVMWFTLGVSDLAEMYGL